LQKHPTNGWILGRATRPSLSPHDKRVARELHTSVFLFLPNFHTVVTKEIWNFLGNFHFFCVNLKTNCPNNEKKIAKLLKSQN
jgi:hypothetical protein